VQNSALFDTHNVFFRNFLYVILLFKQNLNCKRSKKWTFSYIFQKVKPYFFANIYQSPLDSHQVLNIEAP